ncbi:zonadhesin-like isoform X1 [Zeugodacus cucurbitae]|uniref:Zonadhesin n=1 Tax=Zeugodacus cucurbitae TaxID=28588 RepID=A0A0A1XJY6_ZEUCU|nr:zonadhesin-like isoform X1 [Zeugodacus cucurbitae]
MSRNLFTLLFGATLLVTIFMITHAQMHVVAVSQSLNLRLTTSIPSLPTKRPIIPTIRPSLPTRRPIPPTKGPRPPTKRPRPPTKRPTPPTKRPTRKPSLPTERPITRRPSPPTWTVTLSPTRKPRRVRRPIPRPCGGILKCSLAGPSICVRSRNKKMCRRVANQCSLRKLNCQSQSRNNWFITQSKHCGNLKVGGKAAKCRG